MELNKNQSDQGKSKPGLTGGEAKPGLTRGKLSPV